MSLVQDQSQSKMHIIANSICSGTPGMEDISHLITEDFHRFTDEVFGRKRKIMGFQRQRKSDLKWIEKMRRNIDRVRHTINYYKDSQDHEALDDLLTGMNFLEVISASEIHYFDSKSYISFLGIFSDIESHKKAIVHSIISKKSYETGKLVRYFYMLKRELVKFENDILYVLDFYSRQVECLKHLVKTFENIDRIGQQEETFSEVAFTQNLYSHLQTASKH